MSGALQATFQNQRSFGPPPGQQVFSSNTTWVAPAGVTSVSAVAVAPGRSGDFFADGSGGYTLAGWGGCLSYRNNITVVPGTSYTVNAGTGNVYFISEATLRANSDSTRVGDGGGNGGAAVIAETSQPQMGGSGAGGYAGNGGLGGLSVTGASAAAGGGAGAGSSSGGRGGGGVGLLGQGSSGAGGTSGTRGGGGSGGTGGGTSVNGGAYGGGGGTGSTPESGTAGGSGAIRIIWPGTTRQFPSTNTGDL